MKTRNSHGRQGAGGVVAVAVEGAETFWIRGDRAAADSAARGVAAYMAGRPFAECVEASGGTAAAFKTWTKKAGVRLSVAEARRREARAAGRGRAFEDRVVALYRQMSTGEIAAALAAPVGTINGVLERRGVRLSHAEDRARVARGETARGRALRERVVRAARAVVSAKAAGASTEEAVAQAAEEVGVYHTTIYDYLAHPLNPYGEAWRTPRTSGDPDFVRECCAAVVAARSVRPPLKSVPKIADDFGVCAGTVYDCLRSEHNPYPRDRWHLGQPAALRPDTA